MNTAPDLAGFHLLLLLLSPSSSSLECLLSESPGGKLQVIAPQHPPTISASVSNTGGGLKLDPEATSFHIRAVKSEHPQSTLQPALEKTTSNHNPQEKQAADSEVAVSDGWREKMIFTWLKVIKVGLTGTLHGCGLFPTCSEMLFGEL